MSSPEAASSILYISNTAAAFPLPINLAKRTIYNAIYWMHAPCFIIVASIYTTKKNCFPLIVSARLGYGVKQQHGTT